MTETLPPPTVKRLSEYRIYKPNKQNNGAATKFQVKITEKDYVSAVDRKKVELFIVSTEQTGLDEKQNAKFAWNDPTKEVTMKLGIPDVSEMLITLRQMKKVAGTVDGKYKGLFHQNPKGNSSLVLERTDRG